MNPAGRTCSGEHRGYHHGNLREALVAAGVELARADGPNAVVLRAASRQAGVSHNAAYRHFANQKDLLAAVAQRCMTQLSLLMIERMDRVTTRDCARRAAAKLEAIGRAYIDFARTEPGWFRTALSSARRPPGAGSTAEPAKSEVAGTESVPRPYDVLRAAVDELVDAGGLTAERRIGAEYAVWSAVHGLSSLLLDGPLRDLPDPEAEQAMITVLAAVCEGLA
jgi:AcrR family transcriptional regulator